jgi:hypothetical protein
MKKLIALMALAGLIATGCARNKGGTSEGNYNSSDTGKMEQSTTPSQSTTSTNSSSSTSTGQQP